MKAWESWTGGIKGDGGRSGCQHLDRGFGGIRPGSGERGVSSPLSLGTVFDACDDLDYALNDRYALYPSVYMMLGRADRIQTKLR